MKNLKKHLRYKKVKCRKLILRLIADQFMRYGPRVLQDTMQRGLFLFWWALPEVLTQTTGFNKMIITKNIYIKLLGRIEYGQKNTGVQDLKELLEYTKIENELLEHLAKAEMEKEYKPFFTRCCRPRKGTFIYIYIYI